MEDINQQPILQQDQNIVAASSTSSHKKTIYIILVIAFISVLVAGSIGYILGVKQKQAQISQVRTTAQATITQQMLPTATISPENTLAGWKTYTATALGF